jgi:hypothetical protein
MKRYTDLNKIIIGEEMLKKYIAISIASFLAVNFTFADEPKVAHNTAEWQIWAYSTAAPDFIGDFATVKGANGEVLREGTNGWVCVAFNPMPAGGFNTPHDANPACGDAASLAWVDAYMNNTTPEMDSDGWLWMLHGDTGVDNFRAYSEGDREGSNPIHFIESGPHLMLLPKDPKSLDTQTTDFDTGRTLCNVQRFSLCSLDDTYRWLLRLSAKRRAEITTKH